MRATVIRADHTDWTRVLSASAVLVIAAALLVGLCAPADAGARSMTRTAT